MLSIPPIYLHSTLCLLVSSLVGHLVLPVQSLHQSLLLQTGQLDWSGEGAGGDHCVVGEKLTEHAHWGEEVVLCQGEGLSLSSVVV